MRILLLLLVLCAFSFSSIAQGDENALSISLDSVIVKGYRYISPIKSSDNGITIWNLGSMNLYPQILGNADPIHYSQMIPGIQTNNEYRSGINIEGCENQHNIISIEGIPIYNVNHLLGFFSTFNTSHFSSMSIAKGVISAGSPNRLGGQLDMLQNSEISDSINGIVSVGLISSQGTIKFPINSNTFITTSFRSAYINLLYSRWLKADGQQVRYSFYDANVSIAHHLNKKDLLQFDFYNGCDNGSFFEDHYMADMKARWGNTMGAIHWKHSEDELSSKVSAYISSYRNTFCLEMQEMEFRLPSSITDFGIRSDIEWKKWNVGFDICRHNIHPQSLDRKGTANVSDGHSLREHSVETSIYVNYNFPLTKYVSVSGGIRGSMLNHGRTTYSAVDPSVRLFYANETKQISVTYAVRHQYLFQTGFSDVGLPTEFWFTANKDFKPQYAHELSLNSSYSLFKRRFRLSMDLFYRKLYHQIGYKGSVLDFVNTVYDVYQPIIHGKGENYGFNIMLNKISGHLTGWIGYTYTHARRCFNEIGRQSSYPASHERPHEFNALLSYAVGRSWNFGCTLVYASGTPFTAAQSLYLLNNNLLIKYGDYNASRLRSYMRLDLSANYKWYCKGEHGINFSIYNITSRENELFYYLRTDEDGSFIYRPVTFILNVMPSISYYYKF